MNANIPDSRPRNVREDLSWFLTNLDDQLDDLELEARGVTITLYWDASEVRQAVLGAFDFFDPIEFDRSKFDNPRTMVTCLAAQKWLGSIKMLEPHQAEFAKALRENFYKSTPWLTNEQVRSFFRQVALPDSKDLSLSNLGFRDDKQRAAIISRYAGEASRLFKAVQCMKGAWRNRLQTMFRGEILRFDSSSFIDYAAIFGSQHFQALRSALNERREATPDNNIADAVCLCLLQQQVASFRDGTSKQLPRFFETTSTFRNALEQAGLIATISYLDHNGNPKTILRSSDYFLFRAAFNVRDERVNSPFADVSLESLRQIRAQIDLILKAAKPLKAEELVDITVNNHNIIEVIDDLKHMWILERIWLPFIAFDELKSLDEDERRRIEGFKPEPSLGEMVDKAIEDVTRILDANANQYNMFNRFYRGIEEHCTNLRKRYDLVHPESGRLYQISAIGRFGIPEKYVPDIHELLQGLLLGDDDETRRTSSNLAKLCIGAKSDPDSRTIAIAMLWALEYYTAIFDCSVDTQEHFWLVAIFAAASLKTGRVIDARWWIRNLENRVVTTNSSTVRSAIARSLAYLYFHLWRLEGGRCSWRPDRKVKTLRTDSELQQLVDDSLRYAEIAYKTDSDDAADYAYVVNIFLYYLTEAGTDQQFQTAIKLANELLPWRNDSSVWQYRFDDTLARYFHRRALLAKDSNIKRELLQAHKVYLKTALDTSPGDPEVVSYAGIAANTTLVDTLDGSGSSAP